MTAAVPDPGQIAPQAMSEPHTVEMERIQKRDIRRFWMLVIFFGLLAAVVVAPLFVHQVLQYGQARAAGAPHLGQSPRGVFVDRHGALLAGDRYFYEVTATPAHFNNDEERLEVARQLEELAGLPAAKTFDLLRTYADKYYVQLAPAISLDLGRKILDEQARLDEEQGVFPLQNVMLTATPKRYYPERQLGAHLLGLLSLAGDDAWLKGFYGLEGYYDKYLRQRDGVGLTAAPDAKVGDLSSEVRRFLPSLAGKDLVLTLDRTIQWIIEDELQKGMQQYGAPSGTIIVMEPQTGAILGMANLPTFDPNNPGSADASTFLNVAISAQYEPGSVYKVITAAAALDTGIITPTQKLTDTGSVTVGKRTILNSDRAAHGAVDMTEALARSLNVITAQWATLLGPDEFYHYVDRFGFGRVTGVDLSGEVYGAIKKPGTQDWSMSDLGTNSFGQGLAVTPIQMINAVASIANGGNLMRPYVVAARTKDGEVQYTKPTVMSVSMKPETSRELSRILVDVVRDGNSAAGVAGYSIAGKSGTAQIPTEKGYTEDQTIVTFVGFAPADDPQFVILVKLDRPDTKINKLYQWANYTAAPVFAQVARRLLDYYNIPPDEVRLGMAMNGD